MHLISKLNFSKTDYFSLLLAILPISFIAGNMIININVILIIISALVIFKDKLFKINFYFLDKLLIVFFLLILFTGIYNDIAIYFNDRNFSDWRGRFGTIIKSLFFLKYLFFFITLRFLIEKKILDLKLFFITSTFSCLFVCFDIFIQYFFGKDIFGYEIIYDRKLSGPFGDELIAGGYVQRFSLFAFFLLPIFYNNPKKNFLKYFTSFLLIVFLFGLILAGNRMPLLLFILSLSLIIIFQRQTRKYFLPFVVFSSLFYFTIINLSPQVKQNFNNFYDQIADMVIIIVNKDIESQKTPLYLKEFSTFYETWKLNKYIGGGIKNFRYYCHKRDKIDKNSKFVCNMHPHNYYLEILTETGLIGFSILGTIFILVIYISLYKKYFSTSNLNHSNLIIPFIFLFIVEIFPIKSSGSFFTTGNTTYLILIMGILVSLSRINNSIENKV